MTALSILENRAVASAAPPEVLTSTLGGQEYGIDILAVQEIRRYEAPTRIANAASHLLGIVNLRGVIVPIVDLRRSMGLPAEHGASTVTVIVNVGARTVGLVVDEVSDVVTLDPEQIQPRPSLGNGASADFIVGFATVAGAEGPRMLLLLDLEALLRDF
ncbi:chemotaxis protein CheW [Roseateles saccharophilus]|uniref:Chemotaxis protein CheW n=1 Tax=Roseateles saccharophilus TaxID=304 RepID=A0A4R3UIW8_ROSSA|nr:chemotaxis protein CheW [Roseateles saccharophilus]MDG0834339.1 chemotaxis protein CheW [Roseateles saccharophilus]TCU90702.1 purine-binding chemotaxis protein CheW [Roseateles saccharophilus]